ncbi:MAG: 23S rRNA (adenine(2503)-C(2))-methyltransferase RlmN [Candidatus Omnitrophica bacterium]|nr:23S rRNA (adenine(2503)-C(2))-methyltransferase RlmN [Candidatus Omnitrophota bacterium]
MKDVKNYTLKDLKELLQKQGFSNFSAQQVFDWIYRKNVESFDSMSNLSKEIRGFLKENFCFSKVKLSKQEVSVDGTKKFLFTLEDESSIETVVIPKKDRNTLCLSTQVGCKFNCSFCLSGQSGFKRNLKVSEIINQYLEAGKLIAPESITNIVFMGIGEPLDNFVNLIKSIQVLTETKGINFSKRRISISTCGLIPEIEKLIDLKLGVKLSISLHSVDSKKRTKLMPINRRYPLEELIKAARSFSRKEKHLITFEYALLRGYNTSKQDAQALARILRGMRYKVNLISLNCLDAGYKSPDQAELDSFRKELKRAGVFFTLRESRGSDINAACGQLRASGLNK